MGGFLESAFVFFASANASQPVGCDKSWRLATRFVNRLQVLFPRSWLRNPDFSSKIPPRLTRLNLINSAITSIVSYRKIHANPLNRHCENREAIRGNPKLNKNRLLYSFHSLAMTNLPYLFTNSKSPVLPPFLNSGIASNLSLYTCNAPFLRSIQIVVPKPSI